MTNAVINLRVCLGSTHHHWKANAVAETALNPAALNALNGKRMRKHACSSLFISSGRMGCSGDIKPEVHFEIRLKALFLNQIHLTHLHEGVLVGSAVQ